MLIEDRIICHAVKIVHKSFFFALFFDLFGLLLDHIIELSIQIQVPLDDQ